MLPSGLKRRMFSLGASGRGASSGFVPGVASGALMLRSRMLAQPRVQLEFVVSFQPCLKVCSIPICVWIDGAGRRPASNCWMVVTAICEGPIVSGEEKDGAYTRV